MVLITALVWFVGIVLVGYFVVFDMPGARDVRSRWMRGGDWWPSLTIATHPGRGFYGVPAGQVRSVLRLY